jgi:hypothetical protein
MTMKTGAALVAGVVAILLVSGAVTVWASSSRPQSAMPAAWTAEPSAAATVAQHPTAPVATGNRASSSTTASTTALATSSGTAAKSTSSAPQASTTTKITTTSGTLPSCSGGQTVSTSVFSLKVPVGWKCYEQTGAIIGMYNDEMDIIQVTVSPSKDVVTACGAYLATQSTTSVVAQPDTVWGGKTAKTAKITDSILTAQARCAESKGTIYLMVGATAKGNLDNVVAAMSSISSAWVWK